MQIIEASIFGLRSAQHRFLSPDGLLTITLFPMVHVGESEFFEEVYADAFAHDAVLVEGVRSPITRVITSSYRWINLAKLGLTLQPPTPKQEAVRARIVHADLSTSEFHAEWRKIPLWLRLLVLLCAPFVGLGRRFVASRETLAKLAVMEDQRSSGEVLSWDPKFAAFEYCISDSRDARILECLEIELDRMPAAAETRLAIVYGAAHMRAVLADLRKRGFRSSGASWRTVFAF